MMSKKIFFVFLLVYGGFGYAAQENTDVEVEYYLYPSGKKLEGKPIDLLDHNHPDHNEQVEIRLVEKMPSIESHLCAEIKELEKRRKKYEQEKIEQKNTAKKDSSQ